MKIVDLFEALTLSLAKGFVKGWNKNRYKTIFKKYAQDENAYRIYLPLLKPPTQTKVTVPLEIKTQIEDSGYEIDDYSVGIAKNKDGSKKIKIGKLLADKPELAKLFANDKNRQGAKAQADAMVVISRHPYDIAAMSTGRGWTSCMDLEEEGSMNHYVLNDVQGGTIIAYLIKTDDKNINRPIGRVLIKPFVDIVDKNNVIMVREEVIYGSSAPGFIETVDKFLKVMNKGKGEGIYCLLPSLNADSIQKTIRNVSGRKAELYINPDDIKNMEDASVEDQIFAVTLKPKTIEHIKNPSEAVQLAAVTKDGNVLKNIKNMGIKPSKAVQLTAVQQNSRAIIYIPESELTEDLQILAINDYGPNIQHIKNPSEKMMRLAIDYSAAVIGLIQNPSEALKIYALEKDGNAIQQLLDNGDVSEKLQLIAVNNNPLAIRFILDKGIIPSEAVQLAAVTKDGSRIAILIRSRLDIKISDAVWEAAIASDPDAADWR